MFSAYIGAALGIGRVSQSFKPRPPDQIDGHSRQNTLARARLLIFALLIHVVIVKVSDLSWANWSSFSNGFGDIIVFIRVPHY